MGYGFVIAVAVVALLLVWNGVKIVREYQRLVVFRLGRSFGPRGPGIVYLIPIIDKAVWVDPREGVPRDPRADVHHQGQRADLHRFPDLLWVAIAAENPSDPSPRR